MDVTPRDMCSRKSACDMCIASLECYWCPSTSACVSGQSFCPQAMSTQCSVDSSDDFNSIFAVLGLAGVFVVVVAVCIFGCLCTPPTEEKEPRENLLEVPSKGAATIGPVGYRGGTLSEDLCAICLEITPEVSLQCGHSFCCGCVKQWRRQAEGKSNT